MSPWFKQVYELNPSKLVLFDIDGTLLTTVKKAWMYPFADAIREVLQVPVDPTGFHAGGKTDPQIVFEMTESFHLPEETVWGALPAIQEAYLGRLREVVKTPEDAVLKPGIRPLLERLSTDSTVAMGLLTGNFEKGARVKLAVHDLNRYFPFGVYGDGARRRLELAPRVEPLARELFGRAFPGRDTILIGDTFFDIDCGRAIDARVLAVATGPFTEDQLGSASPDHLFADLSDTEKVVEAILG